jgi:hypothetical protein
VQPRREHIEHTRGREYQPHTPKPVPEGEAAIVMCDAPPQRSTGRYGARFTRFESLADAATFAATVPCTNPQCVGVHVVVWRAHGAVGATVVDYNRRTLSLADELADCYPSHSPLVNVPPEFWPAPAQLNEPLQPKGATG